MSDTGSRFALKLLIKPWNQDCTFLFRRRFGTSGVKRLFGGGITDHLLRDARGSGLWIIA